MALNPEQARELRGAIDERRTALLNELRKDVNRSREQQYGELAGPAPDAGDESVAALIADLDHAEVERDVGELRQLDAARSRMDEGSYGECLQCGRDIQYERLRANPSALRCIDCQTLFEKTHAQGAGSSL
jgi:DnaK suppressor protein